MSFNPDAENLLLTARKTLLEELLPALPESLHYNARMIANAMIISSRELKSGHAAQAEASEIFADLAQRVSGGDVISAIRNGEFDESGNNQEALLIGLSRVVRNELAISKPKAVLQ